MNDTVIGNQIPQATQYQFIEIGMHDENYIRDI